MRLFQFEVFQTLLLAGIAISEINALRFQFEKYAHDLTSSSHLKNIIPSVLAKLKRKKKLKAELEQAKEVSVIFDGAARIGEALAIVVRLLTLERPGGSNGHP